MSTNQKLRIGATKPPLGLVPPVLDGVARVLEDSEIKYEPGNFLEEPAEVAVPHYEHAALRHFNGCRNLNGVTSVEAWSRLDADSGLPEIDHVLSNLLIIRALLVQGGHLPRDPGQGARKKQQTDGRLELSITSSPDVVQDALDAMRAKEATRKYDHRCLACDGTGLREYIAMGEHQQYQCTTCKGTGQRNGSEGVRL